MRKNSIWRLIHFTLWMISKAIFLIESVKLSNGYRKAESAVSRAWLFLLLIPGIWATLFVLYFILIGFGYDVSFSQNSLLDNLSGVIILPVVFFYAGPIGILILMGLILAAYLISYKTLKELVQKRS